MKKILAGIGILALAAVIAVPVMAQGPGWGRGRMQGYWGGGPGYGGKYGAGYGNLTDEQRTQLDNLYNKFYQDTASTRSQLWTKRGELNALLNSPNPDPEKAKALQKEINDLRAKLSQDRLALDLEAQKINPDARFGGWGPMAGYGYGPRGGGYGPGYGRGMMGYGYGHMGGYGPGMMGYGYGPGACWN